jgi:hypothetical protein
MVTSKENPKLKKNTFLSACPPTPQIPHGIPLDSMRPSLEKSCFNHLSYSMVITGSDLKNS